MTDIIEFCKKFSVNKIIKKKFSPYDFSLENFQSIRVLEIQSDRNQDIQFTYPK
jgi:hypothetical protein